ncbi:MAG: hypothetical protein U0166_22445 [Acidobacteriota bacterium]
MVPVAFLPREPPLEVLGAAFPGPAARAAGRRLLERDDDALARLRGVAGDELLVLVGDAADLPWEDGAVYLGRDPRAPALYLPTTLAPSVPVRLFERALLRHAAPLAPPLAVLAPATAVASLAGARPVDRAALRAWVRP